MSYGFLDHILGLFETQTENIKLGLEEELLSTLLDFVGTPIADLVDMT